MRFDHFGMPSHSRMYDNSRVEPEPFDVQSLEDWHRDNDQYLAQKVIEAEQRKEKEKQDEDSSQRQAGNGDHRGPAGEADPTPSGEFPF